MDDQSNLLLTLQDVLSTGSTMPAVVQLAGHDVVVLDSPSTDVVEVWDDGHIVRQPLTAPVKIITDPNEIEQALQRAVLSLNAHRLGALQQLQHETDRHAAVLSAIRSYAIRRHQHQVICRGGLNDFLEEFGLPLYEPGSTIAFVFYGYYEVYGAERIAARHAAMDTLKPRSTGICGLRDGSTTYQVTVSEIVTIASPDEPRLGIRYTVAGQCLSDITDADHLWAEVLGNLSVDLDNLSNVVPGTAVTEISTADLHIEPIE